MTKLKFRFSNAHYNDEDLRPSHGPQTWPWWRLLSIKVVRLDICLPSTGYRAWIYTKRGAVYFDLFIDRRAAA